jgi:hypothetical protein
MMVAAYSSFNHLDPNAEVRKNNQAYFCKLIASGGDQARLHALSGAGGKAQSVYRARELPRPELNFEPSHFVRQFIDPVAPARPFGRRIYHVHAKDAEIIEPMLQKRGIHGQG